MVGTYGAVATDVVEVYDIDTDTWSRFTSLPTPLLAAAGAVVDGSFYVCGGFTDQGQSSTVYGLSGSSSWQAHPPLPSDRVGASVTAVSGQLWISGGLDADTNTTLDLFEELTPSNLVLYAHRNP